MNRPALAAFVLSSALSSSGCDTPPTGAASLESAHATAPRAVSAPAAKTYDVSEVDRRPVPVKRRGPQYPIEMRRRGVTGEAMVEFIVDTNGQVRDARAVEATHAAFASAAVAAVSSWEFVPAVVAGRPVNTRLRVPIRFTLNDR